MTQFSQWDLSKCHTSRGMKTRLENLLALILAFRENMFRLDAEEWERDGSVVSMAPAMRQLPADHQAHQWAWPGPEEPPDKPRLSWWTTDSWAHYTALFCKQIFDTFCCCCCFSLLKNKKLLVFSALKIHTAGRLRSPPGHPNFTLKRKKWISLPFTFH